MEFKGTKGKWSTNTHCVFSGDEELIGENVICRLHTGLIRYMGVDQKANALLISKAPEMLEMLKINYDYFEELAMFIRCDDWTEDFRVKWTEIMTNLEKLIDEATNV